MNVTRGDVVLVGFPQGPGQPVKRRPAVVVQSDHNNVRLRNSIFVMVTSNTSLATQEAAQVLIDAPTPEGKQSGLTRSSAVKCENIHTLPVNCVIRRIGRLTDSLMLQVDDALKASLGLS